MTLNTTQQIAELFDEDIPGINEWYFKPPVILLVLLLWLWFFSLFESKTRLIFGFKFFSLISLANVIILLNLLREYAYSTFHVQYGTYISFLEAMVEPGAMDSNTLFRRFAILFSMTLLTILQITQMWSMSRTNSTARVTLFTFFMVLIVYEYYSVLYFNILIQGMFYFSFCFLVSVMKPNWNEKLVKLSQPKKKSQ